MPQPRPWRRLGQLDPAVLGTMILAVIAIVDAVTGVMLTGVYAAGAVVAATGADVRRTSGVAALGVVAAVVALVWHPDHDLASWSLRFAGLLLLTGLAVASAVNGRRLRERLADQDRLSRGILGALAADLSGAGTVREVADRFVGTLISVMDVQSARVYVLDADDVLRSLAWHTPHDPEDGDEYGEVPLSTDLPGAIAVRERRPLHLVDRRSMDAVLPGLSHWYPQETSLHVLPLLDGEDPVGLLALSFVGERTVGRTAHALVETLAHVLSRSLVVTRERQQQQVRDQRAALLDEADEQLAPDLHPDRVLQVGARLLVPRMADWCSISLVRPGELEVVAIEHRDPARVEWAWQLVRTYPTPMDTDDGAAGVVRTARPELRAFVPDQVLTDVAQDLQHLDQLRSLRATSSLLVPILDRAGAVIGVLSLLQAESARRFTDEDVAFAETFARRLSSRLLTARSFQEQEGRLREVMLVAEATQRAILAPPLPRIGAYRVAARYVSAAAEAQVGGDMYEAVQHGDAVRLLVGDVRGKGLDAVRTATIVLGEFRSAASDVADLREVPRFLDRRLSAYLGPEDFVTAAVVELRPDGSFSLLTCGHPAPVVVRADGLLEEVASVAGVPLGLGSAPLLTHGLLAPGDRMVLFTDGLVEARLADRTFVAVDDVLKPLTSAPFDTALDGVLDRLTDLVGSDLGDDLALVLAELAP